MNNQKYMEQLAVPIKLSFPVINVSTFELGRAETVFELVAKNVGKAFVKMPFKKLPDPNTLKAFVAEATKDNKNGVVVFDTFFHERMKANHETMPALKSSLFYLENEGINYIIAGKETMSDEFVYHIDLPAMDDEEIIELLKTCEQSIQESGVFDDSERSVIANYARGLSHTQMKNVFTYSAYLKFKNEEYLGEIRKEKAHILRDVGLDVLEPTDIDNVGGLENLKEFLNVRKAGWDRNLPVKGVLLAGVPGGGKSLTAKAAAGVLGTSLVRLDMGRFYSKYLGETERLFNRALQTIEEISPTVVLIDEIEKFFGNADGEHEVSKRLLGSFLYWLQERKKKIFIVATANRVQSLPPELMRAGRWDRAFFIDLPTSAERHKIFEIHISKQNANLAEFDLNRLVAATSGYTGAEIEQAVIDALYLANAEDKELNNENLLDAVGRITPTSETRKEDIDQIRRLRDQGFYPANNFEEENQAGSGRKVSV
ncbi:AAA family ATPase [Vibrio cholerae]|uniref:AAA family ATPase n=1 Tax=Vibrio cholerae TaxID=666 RepID=UPI00215ED531|nr:AAA family ATPase [Vibrio cholerae]MCS0096615.1 AAA family ATPase [Vibrio cholerae]